VCRVFEHLAKSFCVHGVLCGPSLMEEHLRYITHKAVILKVAAI